MKKTYTKKQIREAISYWEGKLRRMNESEYDNVMEDVVNELAGRPDIPNYLKQYIKDSILEDAGHDGVGWYDWSIDEFVKSLEEERVIEVDVADDNGSVTDAVQIRSKLPLKFTRGDIDRIIAKTYPERPGVYAMSVSVKFDYVKYYAEFSGCFDDREWRDDICGNDYVALDLDEAGDARRLCVNGRDVCRLNIRYDLVQA